MVKNKQREVPMAEGEKASPEAPRDFVATVPWSDSEPDCLVLCCSDHRFNAQTQELVRQLGFKNPHVVQVPGGSAMTLPLISAFGFISKTADNIVEGIIERKKVKTVICVGHRDCGAYMMIGNHPLVVGAIKKLAGKDVRDIQCDHLRQAAKRMKLAFRGVEVRTFFAETVEEGGVKKVKFEEVAANKS